MRPSGKFGALVTTVTWCPASTQYTARSKTRDAAAFRSGGKFSVRNRMFTASKIGELEERLLRECAAPRPAVLLESLPSLGIRDQRWARRQPMRDSKLNDVQAMIERAGDHRDRRG